MSRNGVGLGLDCALQFVDRLLIAAMLAVGNGIGDQFIRCDAVFRIGQIAAADSWVTAPGKPRIAQGFQSLHQRRIEAGFFGELFAGAVIADHAGELGAHLLGYRLLFGE